MRVLSYVDLAQVVEERAELRHGTLLHTVGEVRVVDPHEHDSLEDGVHFAKVCTLITDQHQTRQVEVDGVRVVLISKVVRRGHLADLNHLIVEAWMGLNFVPLGLLGQPDAVLFVVGHRLIERGLVLL